MQEQLSDKDLRRIGIFAPPGTTGRYIEAGTAVEVFWPRTSHPVVLIRSNDDTGASRWVNR